MELALNCIILASTFKNCVKGGRGHAARLLGSSMLHMMGVHPHPRDWCLELALPSQLFPKILVGWYRSKDHLQWTYK